ncbi:MAG: flippase-like domain-containing protein [Deltaproteobacteria bacterium]|nr:flippase-like domain-containing protein [Deltaproteobacteria bacterium]
MRLAINLLLSLGMLALCVWLVWPDADGQQKLSAAIDALHIADFWPYLAGYIALLAVTHFCRAWRWNNLLAPIGVRVPHGRLLAISSVGFMAILALPARLGEFVRPALIRKQGEVSASAALGTVAVERIVDGLIISVFVFGAFLSLWSSSSPRWMMPVGFASLGIFGAALVFLIFALRRPEATVRWCLRMSLIERFAPRIARVLEVKLLEMFRGFGVLRDRKNLAIFGAWSLVYWIANGFSLWVLARGFHLDLSVMGAFATMGVVAVGITLPNSPGMVGQYQWFTLLGLSLYLGPDAVDKHAPLYGTTLAYALILHGLQVIWYLAMGGLAMLSSHISFAELWGSRKLDPAEGAQDDASHASSDLGRDRGDRAGNDLGVGGERQDGRVDARAGLSDRG